MTNKIKNENFSKANPVGLRALTKLIVYGDLDRSVFTEAERLFVDDTIQNNNNNQNGKLLDKFGALDLLLTSSLFSLISKKSKPTN